MKLAELQRYFASAATSGSGPLPELERVFFGSKQLSAQARLAIYNRAYFYRLLDALASVFGHTKRLLGELEFERLGLAYLSRHPSEHPAVERIGRAFPEYLRVTGAPPLIVDLASLEWARLCALVAPNPASIASVHAIQPSQFPEARLRFVPSLHWLELDPRVLSAFAGEQLDSSAVAALQPACRVAIWRSQHVVMQQAVADCEWQAFSHAASGATLSQVCSVFDSGSAAEDVQRAFRVLSGWFARNWLEKVEHGQALAI
ncbi:MAG TPA: DNA-binding domain-containing protein [Polyangiaceae bacterium]|nr:DNA-binding domain-containing protein [Polyangiaceae bacterium]